MLVGLGAGAVMMYLLDPKSGRNRRHWITDSARERAASAGTLLAGRARHAMDVASDEFSHHASHAANDVRDTIPTSWRDRASNWIRPQHSYFAPAAGITAGGIALVALGAGLAYFFDPYRGRARRSVAGNLVRQTGERLMSCGNAENVEEHESQEAVEMEREPSAMHREPEPNEI